MRSVGWNFQGSGIFEKTVKLYRYFEKYEKSSIRIFCDNQSAIQLSKNAVLHKRSKHIDISFYFVRELEGKKIEIYLRTDQMSRLF